MTKNNINSRALDALSYILSNGNNINKSELAKSLGITASKLSEITGERMMAGTEILAGLTTLYNISPQWLLTGSGPMVNSEILNTTMRPKEVLPNTELFDYVNNDNDGRIPVIHELSFALQDPDRPIEVTADEYYYIKEFRNADFLLRFSGDYMLPRFKPGDLLACRNVKYSNFYQWGRIYALLTCHQGLVIGRVFEHHQSLMFIRVKPMNPDYPDWEIPLDEVAKVAIVVGSISTD